MALPGFRLEGEHLGGRMCKGLGGPTPGAGEFSNIFKRFLKKIAKKRIIILANFSKNFKNPACVWTKNPNWWDIFEKTLKMFDENFIEILNF